jgi:hypothetical protein
MILCYAVLNTKEYMGAVINTNTRCYLAAQQGETSSTMLCRNYAETSHRLVGEMQCWCAVAEKDSYMQCSITGRLHTSSTTTS